MKRKWLLRQTSANIAALAQAMDINPTLAWVLAVRGYNTIESAKAYLNAEQSQFAPFNLFCDMKNAADLTIKAIKNKHKIIIFGDYDADGIMSTVILYKTLKTLNANVSYYIPNRIDEGYGLNNEAISTIAARGGNLILACDNGTSSFEQIDFANSLGLNVVVLDHHDLTKDEAGKEIIPNAAALVNPKREDCAYPFKLFSAGGICYRFAEAILSRQGLAWENYAQELLPFAVISTVCDLVDLTGENRILVKKGIPLITECKNYGLRALIKETGCPKDLINTYHIAFVLGPCINASGRLDAASQAVELFITDDAATAAEKAVFLVQLNSSRKEMTMSGYLQIVEEVAQMDIDNKKVLVLYSPQISESVAGIIAGKIKSRFNRPTIMICGEKDILRGSCRSVEGYNIFEALSECKDLFLAFGGHPMAAGFSIRSSDIDELRIRLNNNCCLSCEEMLPIIRVDKMLPLAHVNLDLVYQFKKMEPFGKANSAPLFAETGLLLTKVSLIGKTGQFMRLQVKNSHGQTSELLSFDCKERLEQAVCKSYSQERWNRLTSDKDEEIPFDVVYSIGINSYNGRERQQIQLYDFRLGAGRA